MYGYVKPNRTSPSDNIWTSGNQMTLLNNSVVLGYEGELTETNEDVVIIGDAEAFVAWKETNTISTND
jgi:hypothetical protein